MKKNRILCLILSVMMVFTLVFPTGVIAEDAVAEEVVAEEVVAEEVVTEEVVTEEVVTQEVVTEEAEAVFAEGYVRIETGTAMYENESVESEFGYFTEDAVIYGVVTTYCDNMDDSWLWVIFDTEDSKAANGSVLYAYVKFGDVMALTADETAQVLADLGNDSTTRTYENILLTVAAYALNAEPVVEAYVEEAVVEEVFAAEISAAPALAITVEPEDVEASIGDTAVFTVVAEGDNLSYQWQLSSNGGAKWYDTSIEGNQTDTLSVQVRTATRFNQIFRCVVTDGNGNSVTTRSAAIIRAAIIVDDVTYEAIDETTCLVVSYAGTAASLTIPEVVEGMTVVEIGVEAFMGNTTLVDVDLPDTITVIRARAFKNCSNLSEMR